jgi:hypothetical protein
MSNDNLKKFFSSNRDAFDSRTPPEGTWKRVERALFGAKEVSLWNSLPLWRAAAAVLLGLTLFQFVSPRLTVNTREELAAQQEFTDVESFYSAEISHKVALIRNEGSMVDDAFTQDIEKLEAMYAVLSEEMKKRPSQKVKDALVLNMLVRIDLLNQQIQRLEEKKEGVSEL